MIRFIAGVLVGAFAAAYALAWWLSATPEKSTGDASATDQPFQWSYTAT